MKSDRRSLLGYSLARHCASSDRLLPKSRAAGPAAKRISEGYPPVKRSSMLLATSSQTAAKSRSSCLPKTFSGFSASCRYITASCRRKSSQSMLAMRGRPLLMAQGDKDGSARRSTSTIIPNRSESYLNGYLILFRCRTYHANSHEAGAFETVRGLAARLRRRGDEFHHVEGCAVARGGSASRIRPPTSLQPDEQ